MSSLLLIALQAAANAPTPTEFDLKDVNAGPGRATPTSRCEGASGEIIVCGQRDPDRYRYKLPEGRPEWIEDGVPRAEIGLGHGATGGLEFEQVGNPDGTVSKRIMVRVKTKF